MAQQAQVTEEQARALAEESRESGWDKPSFAKELFLGRFPLELIHPFPTPSADEEARAAAFLGKLREFLDTVDGSVIEREAQIPDEYVKGLAELGCFGMKIPTEYGGLAMSQVAYNRALVMVSSVHASLGALLSAHQSIGVPGTAQACRDSGAEAEVPAAMCCGSNLGVPAHRTGCGFRSGAAGLDRDADRGRAGLRTRGHEAVDHQRRGRRIAGGDGPGAEERRAPRRHQRLRRRGRCARDHRRAAQQVHGIARHRKRPDQAPSRPSARPKT